MIEIVERLRVEGPALSRQVLDDMYADPFWSDRFGDKGRRHANEDSDFHLRYLTRALVAGDPGVLVRYARWLRDVLNSRGMCTRHLSDNFRRLGELLAGKGWPGGDLAVGFLEVARAALLWDEGPAAELQRDGDAIAEEIAHGPLAEAARDLVSYLEDAIAAGRPELFEKHVAWMDGHVQRRGIARAEWRAVVADLERALVRRGGHAQALDCVRAAARWEGP